MSVTIRPITTPNPRGHAPSRPQLHPIDRDMPTDAAPAACTIDCAVCAYRHTSVCDDCVVSFILDRDPEDAVILGVEEERALRMLGRAGLVPTVRHHLVDRDAG